MIVHLQCCSQFRDLGMVSRVPHSMTPTHFVLFEDKFPAHLIEVASFQDIPARSDFLNDRFDRIDQYRSLHVLRALTS